MANNSLFDPSEVFEVGNKPVDKGPAKRDVSEIKSGRGLSRNSIANIFTGFNHRMAAWYSPKNRDHKGYTFYTRPDMCLNEANINASRRFSEMMRGGYNSQAVAIMAMLDPYSELFGVDRKNPRLGATLHKGVGIDNRQAFMPFLSNLQLSLTDWPDSSLDVYTSEEGLVREQWSMADSTYQANYAFSLNGSFRNIDGDPITTWLTIMLEYMYGVKVGTFIPRESNMIRKRIDYQSRIYRFIMDPTNTYVRKWGSAIAVFPTNDNMGSQMNVSESDVLISGSDTIDVNFAANIAHYMDPIILEEFNAVVARFNKDMYPAEGSGDEFIPEGASYLRKLTRNEIHLFNGWGYPHIDTNSYELCWYVYESDYEYIRGLING